MPVSGIFTYVEAVAAGWGRVAKVVLYVEIVIVKQAFSFGLYSGLRHQSERLPIV